MNPVLISALFTAIFAADPAKPTDAPPAPAAAKGHLLAHFKGLSLTADQKTKVEAITGIASGKISDLQRQITAIREQEHADAVTVLTDAQRIQLKTSLTAGVDDGKDKPATETKKP